MIPSALLLASFLSSVDNNFNVKKLQSYFAHTLIESCYSNLVATSELLLDFSQPVQGFHQNLRSCFLANLFIKIARTALNSY